MTKTIGKFQVLKYEDNCHRSEAQVFDTAFKNLEANKRKKTPPLKCARECDYLNLLATSIHDRKDGNASSTA
jgi:hypothetical protein